MHPHACGFGAFRVKIDYSKGEMRGQLARVESRAGRCYVCVVCSAMLRDAPRPEDGEDARLMQEEGIGSEPLARSSDGVRCSSECTRRCCPPRGGGHYHGGAVPTTGGPPVSPGPASTWGLVM